MRILVVGDSYIPTHVFEKAFDSIPGDHRIHYLRLDEDQALESQTRSERSIGEYAGNPRQLAEELTDEDVLVVHGAPVTDTVLDASPNLKLVCCARGGPVNVDVEAASERGIPVVTTPGKNADAVADLTLAFMILLARGIPPAQRFLREGGSLGESALEGARFLGYELGGHTLGLIGYGNVGRRVAKRALAFEMEVLVLDPFVARSEVEVNGARVSALATILEKSDFISLHARATAENKGMIGPREFERIERRPYFINTARETLVDEEALQGALDSGRVAGAALDVVEYRSNAEPHPLLALENVIITPHIGGATQETLARLARMLAEEIERFAVGRPLFNIANRSAQTRGLG